MGLRDDIFAIDDLKPQPVEVPEWGRTLYVRAMSGADRDEWETLCWSKKDGEPLTAKVRLTLMILCTVDEHGEPVFSRDDIEKLAKKNYRAMKRLIDVARELNGFGDEAIAEREKNSGTGPTAAS